METFRLLMKIAVAGTAMTTAPPETGVPALDTMLGSMPECPPERRLLAAAGCLSIYRNAGADSFSSAEPPPGADEDVRPALPQRGAAALAQLLTGDLRSLLPVTLALMQERRVRLPDALLPDFLDVKEDLQPCVRPVLGTRGVWLAAQNAEWRWALEENEPAPHGAAPEADDLPRLERLWLEGDMPARVAALRRMRATEPDRARDWLEESWKRDKADQRAAFLELVREGLGPADIPFLEGTAKDRSQKIRSIRFELLATLPGSSIAEGLKDHASFIRLAKPIPQGGVKGMLKKLVWAPEDKPRLSVELPDAPDAFWQEAGISVKPPQGIGPKAWLLQQMLALIPLDFWQEQLHASPEELIDAACETEWSLSILEGWARSAISMPGSGWLPPLVTWWRDFSEDGHDAAKRGRQLRAELLPGLVAADPDQRIGLTELLLNGSADSGLPWPDILKTVQHPWPLPLARLWLTAVRSAFKLQGTENRFEWLETLPLAAGALPDECLAEALAWDLPEKQENETWGLGFWRKSLAVFCERIELRRVIAEEIHLLHNGGS